MTKIEQKAFNYAKAHGTLGLDYNQVYDAFLAGQKETISAVEKVLDDVFYEIKMGHIERAYGVYDEIEKQLKNLIEDEK